MTLEEISKQEMAQLQLTMEQVNTFRRFEYFIVQAVDASKAQIIEEAYKEALQEFQAKWGEAPTASEADTLYQKIQKAFTAATTVME